MVPDEITRIGDVRKHQHPAGVPHRPRPLEIEVGDDQYLPIEVLRISQDAALALLAKLTPLLKARGRL